MLYAYLSLDVAGTLTQVPVNTAAVEGSTVRFSCASSDINKIRWDYFNLSRTQSQQTIWNGIRIARNVDPRIRINTTQCQSERSCDLEITSVRLTDAGFFYCFETGKNAHFAAALTVVGTFKKNNMKITPAAVSQQPIHGKFKFNQEMKYNEANESISIAFVFNKMLN